MVIRLVADTFNPQSPYEWVSTGGIVGLLFFAVVGFLRGWVVSGLKHDSEIAALRADIEAKNSELAETRLFVRDQMMPLLTRSQDVLAKQLTREIQEQAWETQRRNPS